MKNHIYDNNTPYVIHTCTVYDRILVDSPAKNTVYTPNIYGSGQPYTWVVQHRKNRSVTCGKFWPTL